jgi:hypothetical protein
MGTLNQVPDTEGYLAAGTEAKMWIWNLDAWLARAKRIKNSGSLMAHDPWGRAPRASALRGPTIRKGGPTPGGVPPGRTDPPPSAQAKHAPSRCEPRSRATARRAAH